MLVNLFDTLKSWNKSVQGAVPQEKNTAWRKIFIEKYGKVLSYREKGNMYNLMIQSLLFFLAEILC